MPHMEQALEEYKKWISSKNLVPLTFDTTESSLIIFLRLNVGLPLTIYVDNNYPRSYCGFRFIMQRYSESGEQKYIREYVEESEPRTVTEVLEALHFAYLELYPIQEKDDEIEEDVPIENLQLEGNEDLLRDIVEEYKDSEEITIDEGDEMLWKVTYSLPDDRKVEVGIDLSDLESSYPKARILSPKLHFDSQNGITRSGVVTIPPFTPNSWSGKVDFVGSLKDHLTTSHMKSVDDSYSSYDEKDFDRLKRTNPKKLEIGSSERNSAVVTKNTYKKLGLDTTKALEVQNSSGLTHSVSVDVDNSVQDDVVYLPNHSIENLFLESEKSAGVQSVTLPTADKVIIEVEDPDLYNDKDLEKIISRAIDDYKIFNEGDVLTVEHKGTPSIIHVLSTSPEKSVTLRSSDWEDNSNIEVEVVKPQSNYISPDSSKKTSKSVFKFI